MTTPILKNEWLKKANNAAAALHHQTKNPAFIVKIERNHLAFQHWSIYQKDDYRHPASLLLPPSNEWIFDFDTHSVGYITLHYVILNANPQNPVQVKITPAEVLAELRETDTPTRPLFRRGWLDDSSYVLDANNCTFTVPVRHALQYIAVQRLDSSNATLTLTHISLDAVSAVAPSTLLPLVESSPLSAQTRELDRISLKTLENCMQDVFEDGPKRDRRLWLGDLRLQAQTNYLTFKNYNLVKRCLYLLSVCTYPDGRIPACVYQTPTLHAHTEYIPDYAYLFGPTLLDYCEASSDWETGLDLYALAEQQFAIGSKYLDMRNILCHPEGTWLFVDWCEPLNRQAAEQAIFAYGLQQTAVLADKLGLIDNATRLRAQYEQIKHAALKYLFNPSELCFMTEGDNQISWASQIWMILADIISQEDGKHLFEKLLDRDDIIQPGSPYLVHHQIEALLKCGMQAEASATLEKIYGTMLDLGAKTYWEVFVPGDQFASPYGSYLFNSYCHAWSCTPAYFFRKTRNT